MVSAEPYLNLSCCFQSSMGGQACQEVEREKGVVKMPYSGDYLIGLDMGTSSVGWAVTDMEYHILKQKGKALWGIRLFDAAQTAAARRVFRTNRRRNERKKQRIQWLQQLFDAEIAKADPAFFQRLKESKFTEEEKQGVEGKYTLFSEETLTDQIYYETYPTIYHLRKALLEETGPFDVRLVYLALHHIIKNRGHFLLETNVSEERESFSQAFHTLQEYLQEQYELDLTLPNAEAFAQHLKDRKRSITAKKKILKEDAGLTKADGMQNAIVDLLAGAKVKLAVLFQDDTLKNAEPGSLSLDMEWDEEALAAVLGEKMELLLAIKAVYDWAILDDILNGQEYLSQAKVQSYEKHKQDLALLKQTVKTELPEQYAEVFHTEREKLDNYAAYSGTGSYHCTYEAFRKYLNNLFKRSRGSQAVETILTELEQGTFLPKQRSKPNSVIPNQVHRKELVDILARAAGYLPFLTEKDQDGISVSQKILAIFDFRIPYYVGPLNPTSPHAWVKRSDAPILPWTFEQVVNLEESAEGFITRMTAKCTYLKEDVLPKDSLLYSEFMVLNELNNLRINGKRVSPELKQQIYRDLFLQKKTVKRKQLEDYLKREGILQRGDEISGIDGDFKASLHSYQDFAAILQKTGNTEMVEDLIRRIVLFGEDRKLLKSYVQRTYGEVLSPEDIQYVCQKRYTGWGRLSQEFLTKLYHVDDKTGEAIPILEMMRRTNCNLMELLSSRYQYLDQIQKYNQEHYGATTQSVKEMVEASYAPPSIKRAILQTVAIVEELVKIMGHPPKRIFVEMARGEEEKKRTVSRKATLEELYKSCKKEAPELLGQLEGCSDQMLRRDKLYLYYTQMGKCMYSGEPIDLERLDTDYDIDHIYPQSKVKDDSLDNRVLVKRELNAAKADEYPIVAEIRDKMRPFWTYLKGKGLISSRKYDRLTRATTFLDEELAGFISRQLVETRQSSKIVAEILGKQYGKPTEIVYVKAGTVADFRQKADRNEKGEQVSYDFVKCREVNDYHHAKDAYLNIVVGNVYHLKFTKDPLHFIKSEAGETYSLKRVFDYRVVRDGETAWLPGEEGSISTVRKTIRKNNILFTQLAYKATGGFYDQTIQKKGGGQAPIKSRDPRMRIERFGGYNKLTGAYFCLVEHGTEKKRIRSLEAVYLMYERMYQAKPEEYCKSILGLTEPKVLLKCIKIGSLLSYDGFLMHICGRSGIQIIYHNANELIVSPEMQGYIKAVGKFLKRMRESAEKPKVTSYDKVNEQDNLKLYDVYCEKLQAHYGKMHTTPKQVIQENRDRFEGLDLYQQLETLGQVLNLFTCNALPANLSAIGGSKKTGILLTTKNLPVGKAHTMKLIHQSVTGVFEQEIDLLGEDLTPHRR